jgi:hypothetical protein
MEQRIAVFDNDDTPWWEQPVYVQLAFVPDDRFKSMAPCIRNRLTSSLSSRCLRTT